MSAPIDTYLRHINEKEWASEVRTAIVNAIRECYNNTEDPELRTDALEAAIQVKIDTGQMAALTIGDGTITAVKLANNSVTTSKIADGNVTTPKIANGSVTAEKLDPNMELVTIDPTLSNSGEAADAKVVGDAISELNGSLENFYNGEPNYVSGWKTGYITTNGSTVNVNSIVNNNQYKCVVLDVAEGDRYYVHIKTDAGVARGYCFIDAETSVLLVSSGGGSIDTTITAPENAVKLIINIKAANDDYAYKVNVVLEELQEHEDEITLLQKNPILDTAETYNLVDYINDVMWNTAITPATGRIYPNNGYHFCYKYIPVEVGDVITSDKRIYNVLVYDSSKAYVAEIRNGSNNQFWFTRITQTNAAYIRVSMYAYGGTHRETDLSEYEPFSIYKATTETPGSDRRPAVPKTQIDGRYVTKSVYDVSIPDIDSDFMRHMQMRMIKKENAEKGVFRIGSFNIFGVGMQEKNWWLVKKELTEYGVNLCGFQEVPNGTVVAGETAYSFTEVMTGECFPYADLTTISDEADMPLRAMSDGYISLAEKLQRDIGETNPFKCMHVVVDLPNYHHNREWNKKLSVYVCHFNTAGAISRKELAALIEIVNADTSTYKCLMADTNTFSLDDSGKPWSWAYLATAGLRPCLTNFDVSTFCYPVTTDKHVNEGYIDMIDNVFITSNMKCVNWNIVDSQNYLCINDPSVVNRFVSDHCMVYADVIFDYVEGFEDA